MRLALNLFSEPHETVLDPFAGWGTTSVAAALEGRNAYGFEVEPSRAESARRRLRRYSTKLAEQIICADARRPPPPAESVDLRLTSLPYFGINRWETWSKTRAEGQLYDAQSYEQFLRLLDEVFAALAPLLHDEGFFVVMAQNLWLEGLGFAPLAWDAAHLGSPFHASRRADSFILASGVRERRKLTRQPRP